jgi:hypothetical protein
MRLLVLRCKGSVSRGDRASETAADRMDEHILHSCLDMIYRKVWQHYHRHLERDKRSENLRVLRILQQDTFRILWSSYWKKQVS